MTSKPTKFHFHEETWLPNWVDGVMDVDNLLVRVTSPKKKP